MSADNLTAEHTLLSVLVVNANTALNEARKINLFTQVNAALKTRDDLKNKLLILSPKKNSAVARNLGSIC